MSILICLLLTDAFFVITFCTEPGIIPARLWGSILPPKYKGADVIIHSWSHNYRIKLAGYFIGNYPSKGQLSIKWSFAKPAKYSDHHGPHIATLATTVSYDSITTVSGWVLASVQEITSNKSRPPYPSNIDFSTHSYSRSCFSSHFRSLYVVSKSMKNT